MSTEKAGIGSWIPSLKPLAVFFCGSGRIRFCRDGFRFFDDRADCSRIHKKPGEAISFPMKKRSLVTFVKERVKEAVRVSKIPLSRIRQGEWGWILMVHGVGARVLSALSFHRKIRWLKPLFDLPRGNRIFLNC